MKRLLALLLLAVAALPLARAQLVFTPVNPASNTGAFNDGSINQSLSLVFTANQGVTVTQVGYWDMFQDGVSAGPIKVAVFYASGPSIGQIVPGTEIDFSGTTGTLTGAAATFGSPPHIGQFRVATLSTPVGLASGVNYAIVAQGFSPDEYVNGNSNPVANFNTISGALTFVRSDYNTTTPGFVLPADGTISGGNGPQFLAGTFTAIPEPSTYVVILGGLALGVAAMQRMRRRSLAA